jgi:hypothetical protein
MIRKSSKFTFHWVVIHERQICIKVYYFICKYTLCLYHNRSIGFQIYEKLLIVFMIDMLINVNIQFNPFQ